MSIRITLPARERRIRVLAPTPAALPDAWLTQREAAAYLGVSTATLSHWTNRDDNPVPAHCPSPNVVRYRRSEMDDWLAAQPGRSVGAA